MRLPWRTRKATAREDSAADARSQDRNNSRALDELERLSIEAKRLAAELTRVAIQLRVEENQSA